MAAKEGSPRDESSLVGQESSRPERAAAQLCQLKIRLDFSQQSPSAPALVASASPKGRFETPSSSLATGSYLPSVEALLAATVSRVETEVASELGVVSEKSKLPEQKNNTQLITTKASPKTRSKESVALPATRRQLPENGAKLSPVPGGPSCLPAREKCLSNGNNNSSNHNNNNSSEYPGGSSPLTPPNVICNLSFDTVSSPSNSRFPAKPTKTQNSQMQLFNSASHSPNDVVFFHETPLKMPIVYIDDYMHSNKIVDLKSDNLKPSSSPGGSKPKATNGDSESDRTEKNEVEMTSLAVKNLKRPMSDEVTEYTPKKLSSASAAGVRKKELDCPVHSPVMRDSIDSPGSPMTRSMSRRIEESTTLSNDSSLCKPVIPVNCTYGTTSTSETEEPTLTSQEKTSFLNKKVQFNKVSIYFFEREQGFTSVPSEGGSTLGMGAQHLALHEYSVEEYSEVRRVELSLSLGEALPPGQDVEGLIVQPLPTRRRRELLRQSGVRNIDALEKEELQMIRVSREQCGCSCIGRCLPGSCLCLELGIECQVDHGFYPCGCTVEGCSNPSGRHEFNRKKVKVHVKATCARANRELGLPDVLDDVLTAADSPDHFASQEEVYLSSECSENSDYSSSEETVMGELDSLPDSNAEETEDDVQTKQLSNIATISEDSDTGAGSAEGPL